MERLFEKEIPRYEKETRGSIVKKQSFFWSVFMNIKDGKVVENEKDLEENMELKV